MEKAFDPEGYVPTDADFMPWQTAVLGMLLRGWDPSVQAMEPDIKRGKQLGRKLPGCTKWEPLGASGAGLHS